MTNSAPHQTTLVLGGTIPALSPVRRALGWAAIAGTVPYVTLKLLWLAGATIGVADPRLLAEPSIIVLNAVTLALDVSVVALALALTTHRGRVLPGWLVLLPMWVGTGFLLPMALSILPATIVSAALSPSSPAAPNAALEPWVQPLVYGGFAWQGMFLIAAFVLYARDRWSSVVEISGAPSPTVLPLLRAITVGGVAMATLSAGLHLAGGAMAGDPVTVGVQIVNASLAVAGALGVAALLRPWAVRRWLVVGAAWSGSAAMFSWGLWAAVVTMGTTALARSVGGTAAAVGGFAQLTGLLGGFALAVAGLLALAGAAAPVVEDRPCAIPDQQQVGASCAVPDQQHVGVEARS